MFNKVTDFMIKRMEEISGKGNVITDSESLENYAHDETPFYHSLPEVVVKPATTKEISEILTLAGENLIPITPRGGGTSLSGGAVPVYHGIVLSLERMNRIKEIDQKNLFIVVEPGIITGEMDREIEKYNLLFPPDPVSLDSCTIGGNIAECAGGPRAMKYGVTKNYVTGLEVAFADGKVCRIGGKLLKDVTGYDLINLIIGSEGTLGIVTEATLRVLPLPEFIVDLLVPFKTVLEASNFSIEIIRRGLMPTSIEFMDGDVVRAVARYLSREVPFSEFNGHTIVEVDGFDQKQIKKIYERIGDIAIEMGAPDIFVAEGVKDRERIWEIRKKIGEALKNQTRIVAREDLVVPKNRIPELIFKLKECVKRYNGTLYAFGHLGDGNIHTDVGIVDYKDEYNEKIKKMRREMYEITIALGGTITAEHGIGLSKISFLPMALREKTIELMSGIKREFDPKGILNPGKIFITDYLTK
uniref:FAD-binding protein n=1 Tax=candidate division WOR-3 bacterium TaxID=2052148 RepID=A0A7C4XLC3_UNCW3